MRHTVVVLFFILTFLIQTAPQIVEGASSKKPRIRLIEITNNLTKPLGLYHAGDGSNRLFIVEQAGRILILENGLVSKEPFLDIRNRVTSGGEKGLLGLAFHPNFSKNHRFFVSYTSLGSRFGLPFGKGLESIISEFSAGINLKKANPKSEKKVLMMTQPFGNHNGGQIVFGPDGKLFIGMGDGGAGNDPQGNGQKLTTLLGKMLRIDVDRNEGKKLYAIPKDNPFATQTKIAPEIWAYGLRNPWRFSFDPLTGDLYLGDVGQNNREEINIIRRGLNYGWNIMEGLICTPGVNTSCDKSRLESPIFDYPRSQGTVVIGGYVYRGKRIPGLKGAYLYGDFGNGRIWMLRYRNRTTTDHHLLLETGRPISAFGEDEEGELYVIDYSGKILKIVEDNRIPEK